MHLKLNKTHPLYKKEFDLQQNTSACDILITCSICFHFVPRSGSNFLSDLLSQTKTMGIPLEYFSPQNYEYLISRLGSLENIIKARTSDIGCFSFKWNSNFETIDVANFAYEEIKPTFHIFIDRHDRQLQAASFARAKKAQQWFRTANSDIKNATISQQEINLAYSQLNDIRKSTTKGITNRGFNFLTVMYEDMMENTKQSLRRIYRYCEIEEPLIFPNHATVLLPSARS